MGTDCAVLLGDELHGLDRWYVFEGVFESGVFVSREVALRRLFLLLGSPGKGGRADRDLHHRHWVGEVIRRIEASDCAEVMLVHEHHFQEHVYAPRMRRIFPPLGIVEGATWDHVARALLILGWETGFSCDVHGSGKQFRAVFYLDGDRFGHSHWTFEVHDGLVSRILAQHEAGRGQ